MPEIHAESMIHNGCIKLGMLSGYREIEEHGSAVGDLDENTRTVFSHDKGVKTNPDQLNPLESQFFDFGQHQSKVYYGFLRAEIHHETCKLFYP